MFRDILSREYLFDKRFEIFFISLITILFGSLFFPFIFFDNYILPVLLILNIVAGINVISESKKLVRLFYFLLVIAIIDYFLQIVNINSTIPKTVMFFVHLAFYIIITINILKQVWLPRCVNQNLIFGLMCGYISLGMLGFFIFSGIEILSPHSFDYTIAHHGQNIQTENSDSLLYFSFVTLLTIGYGDIIPVTEAAQKAIMLIGLSGQFYLVIITGIVVGKYINEVRS